MVVVGGVGLKGVVIFFLLVVLDVCFVCVVVFVYDLEEVGVWVMVEVVCIVWGDVVGEGVVGYVVLYRV